MRITREKLMGKINLCSDKWYEKSQLWGHVTGKLGLVALGHQWPCQNCRVSGDTQTTSQSLHLNGFICNFHDSFAVSCLRSAVLENAPEGVLKLCLSRAWRKTREGPFQAQGTESTRGLWQSLVCSENKKSRLLSPYLASTQRSDSSLSLPLGAFSSS